MRARILQEAPRGRVTWRARAVACARHAVRTANITYIAPRVFPLRGKIEKEEKIFMKRAVYACAGLFSCPQSLGRQSPADYGLLLCVCMILSLSVIPARLTPPGMHSVDLDAGEGSGDIEYVVGMGKKISPGRSPLSQASSPLSFCSPLPSHSLLLPAASIPRTEP